MSPEMQSVVDEPLVCETQNDVSSLRLDRLPLYGRLGELERLQVAFENMMKLNQCDDRRGTVEVVLVHGQFGTGKSKLIQRFRANNHDRACFIASKCQLHFESLPLAPLIDAFGQLAGHILHSPSRDSILSAIHKNLRPEEKTLLTSAIPSLATLFKHNAEGTTRQQQSPKEPHGGSNDYTFLLLQDVLRNFIRGVTSSMGAVVFKLHDMHLADESTLQVVRGLVATTRSGNFLLIGTYTHGNIPDTHPLAHFLHDLTHMMVNVHDIKLSSLPRESMDRLVTEVTSMKEEEAGPLAQFVYEKSKGCALYAGHLFQSLQRKGYLVFSASKGSWEWLGEGRHLESLISNDLHDIVIDSLKQLPHRTQFVLQVASCIRSSVNLQLLSAAINSMNDIDLDDSLTSHLDLNSKTRPKLVDELKGLLDDVAKRGLISTKDSQYKFSDDVVQECAYQLIPEGSDKLEMHFKLGKLLHQMSSHPKLGEIWMDMAAVSHLNMGSALIMDREAKVELATLNLLVAGKAKMMSAFVAATDYLQNGLDLLPRDRWNSNYALCLELSIDLARMSYVCRDYVRCKHMIDEVIQNASSFEDKFEVYLTHAESLFAQGRVGEAFDVGFGVLSVLGERVRTGNFSLQVSLYRLKSSISRSAVDDMLKSNCMKDVRKQRALKLLRFLARMAYSTDAKDLLFQIQSRIVRISLKYGASPLSAFSFASIGKIFATTGNVEDGFRLANSAVRISEKFPPSQSDSLAVSVAHRFLYHWKRPYRQSIAPLYNGYQNALDAGDVGAAFECACGYSEISYASGSPLSTLKNELRAMREQMIHLKYNGSSSMLMITPHLQLFLNLAGESNDPMKLVGEAMDESTLVEECRRMKANKVIEQVDFAHMQLAYFFGDVHRAYRYSQKLKDVESTSAWHVVMVFFAGLIEVEMFRITSQNKHLKEGRKIQKRMQKWLTAGAVNCDHMISLLQAELENIGGGKGALKIYKQAISIAAEGNFLQNHALANERAAVFCLEAGDTPSACEFMTEAKGLYTKWGAHAKVDQIKEKYQFLFYDLMTSASSKKRADQRKKAEGRLSFGKKWLTQPGAV